MPDFAAWLLCSGSQQSTHAPWKSCTGLKLKLRTFATPPCGTSLSGCQLTGPTRGLSSGCGACVREWKKAKFPSLQLKSQTVVFNTYSYCCSPLYPPKLPIKTSDQQLTFCMAAFSLHPPPPPPLHTHTPSCFSLRSPTLHPSLLPLRHSGPQQANGNQQLRRGRLGAFWLGKRGC